MRLFVALDLDAAAKAAVAAAQANVREAAQGGAPIRWVGPEAMHITLVFLGELDDARAAAVGSAIGRPLAQPPFELTLGGLGVFPPRGAPRAVWVGVSGGEPALRKFRDALVERVASAGVTLESRPFAPHLTLGRWKLSRPSDRSRALAAAPAPQPVRIPVDHATLYRSRLSASGPVYTELARANLTPAETPRRP